MKIAICTPCHGDVKVRYAQSLANMVYRTTKEGVRSGGKRIVPEIDILMATSSRVARSRNELMRTAIDRGNSHALWIDSDHEFPPWTIQRLVDVRQMVVGANQPKRDIPTVPMALRRNEKGELERVYTTDEKVQHKAVEPVFGVGLNICLVDLGIMPALTAQAKKECRDSPWPLFVMETHENIDDDVGEDMYFFRLLEKAGVRVHLDHYLSWHCSHTTEMQLTNAHANQMRPTVEAMLSRP